MILSFKNKAELDKYVESSSTTDPDILFLQKLAEMREARKQGKVSSQDILKQMIEYEQ